MPTTEHMNAPESGRPPLFPAGLNALERLELVVYNGEGELILDVALPGIRPDDVHLYLTITPGTLEIHARASDEDCEQPAEFHLTEFASGTWYRSLRLPEGVNADMVAVTYADGRITLRLQSLHDNESGATAIEYGLLSGLASIAAIDVATLLGGTLTRSLESAAPALHS